MNRSSQLGVLALHGLAGWALCAAVMGVGMATLPPQTALLVHAVAAPIIFVALSWVYFTRIAYTTPVQTALVFLAIVVFMDTFLVALVVLKSFDMFRSFIGTWLPFALIFVATWLTGSALRGRAPA